MEKALQDSKELDEEEKDELFEVLRENKVRGLRNTDNIQHTHNKISKLAHTVIYKKNITLSNMLA